MKPGDRIQILAHKADGTCYRRWHATVESIAPNQLVVVVVQWQPRGAPAVELEGTTGQ